jgi:hypothetical protein
MKISQRVVFMAAGGLLAGTSLHAQSFDRRDLQGIWTNATITPFERPVALGEKEFLTEKEAKDLESQTAATQVDRPPAPGDTGSYNRFWFDSGTKVVQSRRTSLVIEPKNGRVPVKPEAEAKRG